MSTSGTPRRWVGLLLVALALSVAGNVVLFRAVVDKYAEVNRVRRDPFDLTFFEGVEAPEGRPRVVLFGDSRVSRWDPLPALSRIPGAQIVNRAIGGETTAQMIGRLPHDVLPLEPDLVVMQACMNDLKGVALTPWSTARIQDDCLANLNTMLDAFEAAGIPVVLTTVFPAGPADPKKRFTVWDDRILDAIEVANVRIRALSRPRLTVVDCDPYLSVDGRMPWSMAEDTFHLTAKGYEALNTCLEPHLVLTSTSPAGREP